MSSPPAAQSPDRESYDDVDAASELVGSEYEDPDTRMIAEALVTSHGEGIADVMAGIRDSLDKLNKILYYKKSK